MSPLLVPHEGAFRSRPRPLLEGLGLALVLVLGSCGGDEGGAPGIPSPAEAPPPEAIVLPPRTGSAPLVAGFERFARGAAHSPAELRDSGALLLEELACTACHAAEDATAVERRRPAPHLARVAERWTPAALRAWIAAPHAVEPGTTMPEIFAGLDPRLVEEEVDALVHFLVSKAPGPGGTSPCELVATDAVAARRGGELFDSVGCAACHAPHAERAAQPPDSIPLPPFAGRSGLAAMERFLADPAAVRPGERMPAFDLSQRERRDLAHFLLAGTRVPAAWAFARYHDRFDRLEELAGAEPVATGVCDAPDAALGGRGNDYGLRFESYLTVHVPGSYRIHLEADEFARVLVAGAVVAEARQRNERAGSASGEVELAVGVQPVVVEHVQRGREAALDVRFEGPGGGPLQPEEATFASEREPIEARPPFVVDAPLAARGRELFHARGCSACHDQLEPGGGVARVSAPPLRALDPDAEDGCLVGRGSGVPDYHLDEGQRTALRAALAPATAPEPRSADAARLVHLTLARWNCYACHERAGRGGVAPARDPWFVVADPEMGEEGRVPPRLTGIGDRVRVEWLAATLAGSRRARPYLKVRMPRYGAPEVRALAEAFTRLDRAGKPDGPGFRLSDYPVEEGRKLFGEGGMNCILCHDFHGRKAPSAGLIDLVHSAERLHADWFERFLANPEALLPGTRMPAFWTGPRSPRTDVLGGLSESQIRAIWAYLAQGERAVDPEGLSRTGKELVVGGRALLYRGKLWEAGWRGIAVGYPARANLAFDAEEIRLALLWKGRFLDVSPHWSVQGSGQIRPLGTDLRVLPHGRPFAELTDPSAPWPVEESWRSAPYRFRGYDLDASQEPTFRYEYRGAAVEDRPRVREEGGAHLVERELVFDAPEPLTASWFRVVTGSRIEELGAGSFRIDENLTIRVSGAGGEPVIVPGEPSELRVPLPAAPGRNTLQVSYRW